MSDKSKKGSGFPGASGDDDLLAEFDAWDKNLDALFGEDEEETAAPGTGGSLEPVGGSSGFFAQESQESEPEADVFESSLDFLEDQDPLDGLLSDSPPPLPPIEEERPAIAQEGVITSAPRRSQYEELEFDSPDDLFADANEGEAIEEVTRILDVDSSLLAASLPDFDVSGERDKRASSPNVRRSASIVRRDDLERRRAQEAGLEPTPDDDDDFGFGPEATRVADAGQLESLMMSSADPSLPSFFDDLDEPEISVALDDEFYDDIEIGESQGDAVPTETSEGQSRRVSTHLLRRPPTSDAEVSRPIVRSITRSEAVPEPTGASLGDDEITGVGGPVRVGDQQSGRMASARIDPEVTLDLRVEDFGIAEETGESRDPLAVSGGTSTAAVDEEAPTNVRDTRRPEGRAGLVEESGAAFLNLEPTSITGSQTAIPAEAEQPQAVESDSKLDFLSGAHPPVVAAEGAAAAPTPVAVEQDKTPVPSGEPAPAAAQAPSGESPAPAGESPAPAGESPAPAGESPVPAGGLAASLAARMDELPAANNTYDVGLPAVVPDATEKPAVQAKAVPDEDTLATRPLPPVPAAPAAQPKSAPITGREPTAAEQAAASASDLPELPPATLPSAMPTFDLSAMSFSDELGLDSAELAAQTDALRAELVLYERELANDEFAPRAKEFRLEAGELCERLGEIERARLHYEEALGHDPQMAPALRALRRIEGSTGDWSAALNYLDAELEAASEAEKQALSAHRVDVFMAVGEQDLARVVVGEILDADPGNVRALLANLELAFVDERDDEFDETLDRLASTLASPPLTSCMHMLRGRLSERPVGQPSGDLATAIRAYRQAADAGAANALVALALAAQQMGDLEAATKAIARLAGSDFEAREPGYAAALQWRRACWAAMSGDAKDARNALMAAAGLQAGGPLVLADLAELTLAEEDFATSAAILGKLAEQLESPAEKASVQVRLATCLSRLGRAGEAADSLRTAVVHDPADPIAAHALERVLAEDGDIDALIALDRQAFESDPAGAIFERVRATQRLLDAGRHDEAIADLEAGLQAAPGSPALSDTLLDALGRAGRDTRKIELLQSIADEGGQVRDPESVLRALGQAREAHANAIDAAYRELQARIAGGDSGAEGEAAGSLAGANAAADVAADAEAGTEAATEEAQATSEDTDGEAKADSTTAAGEGKLEAGAASADDTATEAQEPARSDASELAALSDRRIGAISAALDTWNRILELDQESSEACDALVRISAMLDEPALLDDALARAQSAAKEPSYMVSLALRRVALILAADEPDLARAEDIAREAMDLAPSDPRPLQLLLNLIVLGGRFMEAALLLEERAAVVSDDNEIASLRYRSAVHLMGDAEEPAQALELLRSVVDIRPGFKAAYELFEAAHKRLGEPMPAKEDEDRVATMRFERLIREAESLIQQHGDQEGALAHYRAALQLRPDDPFARQGLVAATDDPAVLTDLAFAEMARADQRQDVQAKADIYEELARIAGELRDDAESMVAALKSAVELAPERVWNLRTLEKAHLSANRWPELYELRALQLASATQSGDRLAWHASRARIAQRLERSADEIMAEHRAAHELDALHMPALFYVENQARASWPSAELATLEGKVADFFAGDERARATFTTRSAETLAELGQSDEAIARFRAASELCGGFNPALFGWRVAALTSERWRELADAALRAAELGERTEERVALYHLAGVTAMDKLAGEGAEEPAAEESAGDGAPGEPGEDAAGSDASALEEAIGAFKQVLELEPGHHDAFARLYKLYSDQERYQELAQLLETHLEAETHAEKRASLHRALADLNRTSLDDATAARHHLRSILALVPNEPGAVEALSEIAWAEGAWEEAAQTLIARARMAKDVDEQKRIFFRLGTIYADHQPQPQWAIKSFSKVLSLDPNDIRSLQYLARLGTESNNWKLALGASERLLELEEDVTTKVQHLHRMGQIFDKGLKNRARAERAYLKALDLAPKSDRALSALVEFFEGGGDTRAMRVHLNRVLATMRSQLVASPSDSQAYHVIARAMAARERAGVPGSRVVARCAAELVLATGGGGDKDRQLAAEANEGRPKVTRLASSEIDDALFPDVVSNAVRQIFGLVGDRIAKHVGIDLRRYGVGRADRLKNNNAPIARIAEAMAAEMEVPAPVIYVSKKEKRVLVVEPTNPLSLVVGTEVLESADEKQLAFAVGRSLKLALSSFAVPARMTVEEFGVLMVAMLRQFAPEFTSLAVDSDAVAAQQQRLRRLIPSSLIQQLRPFAINIAGPDFNHEALYRGILEAGNRAGLLACGSIKSAVAILSTLAGLGSVDEGFFDPDISTLVRFSVSEDHATLCGQMVAS